MDFFYGFAGGFSSSVKKMTELGLTHSCNTFQTSKRKCFTVLLKKTGHVVKEFIFDFLKRLPPFRIYLLEILIGKIEIFDGFFYRLSFSKKTIR